MRLQSVEAFPIRLRMGEDLRGDGRGHPREGLGKPSKGTIEVPRRPGLGITVDSRFVKAHSR